jgi:hypothetical protein
MCKTNKMNVYYVNICKHEHEKNITRLWYKIIPKTKLNKLKKMKGFIFYLYPFGDLT